MRGSGSGLANLWGRRGGRVEGFLEFCVVGRQGQRVLATILRPRDEELADR